MINFFQLKIVVLFLVCAQARESINRSNDHSSNVKQQQQQQKLKKTIRNNNILDT